MTNSNVKMQVMAALFAAACAVLSQITIPIQPVPISLGSLGVLMAGGFLGRRYGFLSLVIYLLLGAAGVPVFSMLRGGLHVFAGPAGGFIVGYAPMAFAVGWLTEKLGYTFPRLVIAIFLGNLVCYMFGIPWFMYLTRTELWATLVLCVFPFIPGDLAKIIFSAFLINRYRSKFL